MVMFEGVTTIPKGSRAKWPEAQHTQVVMR